MATNSTLGLTKHQADFMRLIKLNSHSHRLHEVFSDFCEIAAISISNSVDKSQFETREARYMQIIKTYTKEEINRFPEMYACVINSLEECFSDCLGELFMSLDLGSHWHGQYFTPYPICKVMSKLTGGNEKDIIEKQGFITVCEPACGAGAMVIAKAEDLKEQGINYQQVMHSTLIDIDVLAVHMAYIQLSLLYVPAVIFHGNALSNETWGHWVTPAHVLGMWDFKLHREEKAAQKHDVPMIEMPIEVRAQTQLQAVVTKRKNNDQLSLF